jgi:hypothetical protein
VTIDDQRSARTFGIAFRDDPQATTLTPPEIFHARARNSLAPVGPAEFSQSDDAR